MADDNWYRNQVWDEQTKGAFFTKLKRARSQRDQYIVIQASTLENSVPEATLELVELYFSTRTNDFHDVSAYWAQASAHKSMKQHTEMIQAYKNVIAREEEFPNHKTTAYVEFPYVVASKKISSEYKLALDVLHQRAEDCTFPVDFYMWHAAYALIALDQGRAKEASENAKKAIEFAGVKKSWFRYHQNIGLVGKEHELVLKKLANISS